MEKINNTPASNNCFQGREGRLDSLPCVLRGGGGGGSGLITYLQLLVPDFDSVHMENWKVLVSALECPGIVCVCVCGGGGSWRKRGGEVEE